MTSFSEKYHSLFNAASDELRRRQTEKYKHTPLAAFFGGNCAEPRTTTDAEIRGFGVRILERILAEPGFRVLDSSLKILAVNGRYAGEGITSEAGFVYGNIADAASMPELQTIIEQFAGSCLDADDLPTAMNLAAAAQGLFLMLPAGATAARPLVIVNLGFAETPTACVARNLFVFGENSKAEILIYNKGLSSEPALANFVSETFLAKNARINLTTLTDESESARFFAADYHALAAEASLTRTDVVAGEGIVRRNTEARFCGARGEIDLRGLTVAGGRARIDNYTFVNHAVPECKSSELYKSIVAGEAANIFNGRILVEKDAQKTAAFQSNKNVLLSAKAKVHSKPQLEIYADDVKCSHGAAIGHLDEEALFYMQARGIDREEARRLLLSGFAAEAAGKVPPPFAEFISFAYDRF
ncbi:MAG: Fe-S cluster assembly protein SufD [Prevotellaceae bacterium]|jgi:Fe-S cluster assembly protein SufD|nr:Fe-S cluster assembly protein SufD [Prevotellaceae bacterium]